MRGHVRYGDVKIVFTIRFVRGQKSNIAIHVMPDGEVIVDAPVQAAQEDVIQAVSKRARWIHGQLQALQARRRHILPREYVSGESHLYLGRRYVLKVVKSVRIEAGVKLRGGRLEVTTGDTDPGAVRRLLEGWYRHHAEEVLGRRLSAMAARANWLKSPPDFRLRQMRTQWGSCSPKGLLLFNPHLVKAPRACVDYVVCHELCHLKVRNHGEAYYRLLGTLLPDWQERKRELDDMAEVLLNR